MKPIKKRILVVLLLLSMIIGFGFNKTSRLLKIKKTNEILQNKNAKEAFISEWYKALDNSKFSIEERQILIDDFLPYLLDNFDMYDVNALANLLSSTANTYIYYVDEWGNDNTKASYTNFLSYVPFGASICEGIITLENNNDDNCFYTNIIIVHKAGIGKTLSIGKHMLIFVVVVIMMICMLFLLC